MVQCFRLSKYELAPILPYTAMSQGRAEFVSASEQDMDGLPKSMA